jgi:hypothetical protein
LVAAALNDLDILVCDIEGAYLTAKCREKIWITAGVEFGSEAGTTMIVKMALYGLKSSGAAFRSNGPASNPAEEPEPPNMPTPRGRHMSTHCFVDSDHAGDKVTRRSQTGVLIFCCRAPILSYSKRQNSVETSTYGSELVAMRLAIDLVKSLRYKLRMFGIPIDGPTDVFCDKESVFKNVSKPESVLSKKQHSISYHWARERLRATSFVLPKRGQRATCRIFSLRC